MTWKVGSVVVRTIVEQSHSVPLDMVLSLEEQEEWTRRHPWLQPHYLVDDRTCRLAVQGFVVDDGATVVLVDTCVGSSDDVRDGPTGPFVEQLVAAGYSVEAVDIVVCTHLHFDHVGWNTHLVGDEWRVTFPHARYVFARPEWEHWSSTPDPLVNLDERVRPVVEAGRAEIVEIPIQLTEAVQLIATPGHTPGHISVAIASGGQRAVITGDMLHHPLQIAEPHLGSVADHDAAAAAATRARCLQEWEHDDVLVVGTHFAPPAAGRLRPDGQGWRLEPPTDGG